MSEIKFACNKTPWHRQSYDRFLQERLPQLLLERGFPLVGYQVQPTNSHACRVTLHLGSEKGDFAVAYDSLPLPDEEGVFWLKDEAWVVVPVASGPELEKARVDCAGELLEAYLSPRIGQAPSDLPWEEGLVRAWLPLDAWVADFLSENAQRLDTTNGYSRVTHLRRMVLRERGPVVMPGQRGRVCPFEMPEGPNIGMVFTIACGAKVEDGRLVIVDDSPAAGLGMTASMIPFLEHSDPNRLLMGANMMRQWLPTSEQEPPLVQTGRELGGEGFWIGRNLLTAFVSWGAGTYSDGIVISQSCAQRLNYPYPAEAGDKLSNRYGTKGVVGVVLPDEQMPHLADGTPVELVYNFASLHMRMNFGQLLEAMISRVAKKGGQPVIVPPYGAPPVEEIRRRLQQAGLPQSGMERLRMGKDGPALDRESLVGWVYWGRTAHLAKGKMKTWLEEGGQQQLGEMEANALVDAGAKENLREMVSVRSARRADAAVAFAAAVRDGNVQPPARSPFLVSLQHRLAAAGIAAELQDGKLAFRFQPPEGETVELAVPMPHPWLHDIPIDRVGRLTEKNTAAVEKIAAVLHQLEETNRRLRKMQTSGAPARLIEDARTRLAANLEAYFQALVNPENLSLGDQPFSSGEPQAFSGRTVVVPAEDLRLDQVGLPVPIARALFAPWLDKTEGDAVQQRLEEVMGEKWVLVNRPPSSAPTTILAFHPLLEASNAIRVHPLVCEWMNLDFDGDQAAVYLPLSEAAQQEAGEKLSVAGHLRRDPALLGSLVPDLDILYGVAEMSQDTQGRQALAGILGSEVSDSTLTRQSLGAYLRPMLETGDVNGVISCLEKLFKAGLAAVKQLGSSMYFVQPGELALPPAPQEDDPAAWAYYREELEQVLIAQADRPESTLSPQLFMIRRRGKGLQQLSWLVAGRGMLKNVNGEYSAVRHGMAAGLTAEEMNTCVGVARTALAAVLDDLDRLGDASRDRRASSSYTVLARARRSANPGMVFARAAAAREVDPLDDAQSRILVGLPV